MQSFPSREFQVVGRKREMSGAEFLFSEVLPCSIRLSALLHHSFADCHYLTDPVHITQKEGMTNSVRVDKIL